MGDLLKAIARLLYLRGSPEAFPDSPGLAFGAAAFSIALAETLFYQGEAFKEVLASIAVSVFFVIAMPWLILRLSKLEIRFNRTLLALAVVNMAIVALATPLNFLVSQDGELAVETAGALSALVGWVICILVWMIAVQTRIWMYATSRSLLACLFLVLFLLIGEVAASYSLP